ncbi:hypothetical protein F5Y16DRAFT_419846 [Xylariaceae sp. FL0255]|nr:hypothetical protein F5Y16DRAFT_419846 [Xylariaceae sp. FL0255]
MQWRAKNKLLRAAAAVPFLLISAHCSIAMEPSKLFEQWQPALDSGVIEWEGGSIPLRTTFYHVELLDWYWRGLTITFAPATLGYDPVAWWTGFEFLSQLVPLYSTWVLESYSLASETTPKRLPFLFMFLGQAFGTGVIVPVFHFLCFVLGPSPTYSKITGMKKDDRIRGHSQSQPVSLLLSPMLFIYLSIWGAFLAQRLEARHMFVWSWFLTPVWSGIAETLLTRLVSVLGYPKPGRSARRLREVQLILLTGIAMGAWVYMSSRAGFSLSTIFMPDGFAHNDLILHSRFVWQSDFMSTFGSTILFLVYEHIELYSSGLLDQSQWFWIAMFPVIAFLVGPGAAAALIWIAKERNMRKGFC